MFAMGALLRFAQIGAPLELLCFSILFIPFVHGVQRPAMLEGNLD